MPVYLLSASRARILRSLTGGPKTRDEISAATQIDFLPMRVQLGRAVDMGLIEFDSQTKAFRLTQHGRAALSRHEATLAQHTYQAVS